MAWLYTFQVARSEVHGCTSTDDFAFPSLQLHLTAPLSHPASSLHLPATCTMLKFVQILEEAPVFHQGCILPLPGRATHKPNLRSNLPFSRLSFRFCLASAWCSSPHVAMQRGFSSFPALAFSASMGSTSSAGLASAVPAPSEGKCRGADEPPLLGRWPRSLPALELAAAVATWTKREEGLPARPRHVAFSWPRMAHRHLIMHKSVFHGFEGCQGQRLFSVSLISSSLATAKASFLRDKHPLQSWCMQLGYGL